MSLAAGSTGRVSGFGFQVSGKAPVRGARRLAGCGFPPDIAASPIETTRRALSPAAKRGMPRSKAHRAETHRAETHRAETHRAETHRGEARRGETRRWDEARRDGMRHWHISMAGKVCRSLNFIPNGGR